MSIAKRKINLTILLISFISLIFADPTNGCELDTNTVFLTTTGDVFYKTDADIAGFQFNVDGSTVSAASGGDAEVAGFTMSVGGNIVLGFSLTGSTISVGCGTLTSLSLDTTATGLSGITFSDAGANEIEFNYYEEDGNTDCVVISEVTSGWYHSLGLNSDGTVVAWGGSQNIGDTSMVYGESDVPIDLSDVISVSAGENHSLALKSDGTVVAWGRNNHGQTDVPIDLSEVIAISGGDKHSLALKSDGTVVAWGIDDDSQSDSGQTDVPTDLSEVISIATSGDHSLALKSDSTVVAWGDNGFNQSNVPADLSNVIAIAAGDLHSLALKSDGIVVGWGVDIYGGTPPEDLTDVIAIEAGYRHSAALKSDGTVVAWGNNVFGGLDVPADLENVVSISSRYNHGLAIKSDGEVTGWGSNYQGQLDIPIYCDCDVNVEDCSGVCGGDAVVDDCGDCNGGNTADLGCGCDLPAPSGCDNTCGSTLEFDECNVCGGSGLNSDGCCDNLSADCSEECGGLDTSCFSIDALVVGTWSLDVNLYENSDCTGEPLDAGNTYSCDIFEGEDCPDVDLNNICDDPIYYTVFEDCTAACDDLGIGSCIALEDDNEIPDYVTFNADGTAELGIIDDLVCNTDDDCVWEDEEFTGFGFCNDTCVFVSNNWWGIDPDGCLQVWDNPEYLTDNLEVCYPYSVDEVSLSTSYFDQGLCQEINGESSVLGCTDIDAPNYDSTADFPCFDCCELQEISGGCDLQDNNMFLSSMGDVFYKTNTAIAGFQFVVDGSTVSAASGGDAEDAEFSVSVGGTLNNTVIGFSFTGATIPVGCGTLTSLSLDSTATGLSTITVSDSTATEIDFDYCYTCIESITDIYGCTDPLASNYNADATIEDGSCEYDDHFNVDLAETGESTLFIFQDTIEGLESGDELGLFDSNGVLDSLGSMGELLVGAGIWTGSQLEVTAIHAVDLSQFSGPILPGATEGNTMSLKVWNATDEMEYDVSYSVESGSGAFDGLFTAISDIEFCEIPEGTCDCDGTLPQDCWDGTSTCNNDCPLYFNVNLSETGESTLFIFQDTIEGLESGDEVGLYDSNGVLDSLGNTGELLVGAGIWTGSQLDLVAIESVDLSQFGGPILPGAESGNAMSLKIWKNTEQMEYEVSYTIASGSGTFDGLFTAINDIVFTPSYMIVINEFFFRANEDVPDYIELFNYGLDTVDLTGWTLRIDGDEVETDSLLNFNGYMLGAGDYLLLAGEDPFFDIDSNELYAGNEIWNSLYFDISLANNDDIIELFDAEGNEVDFIAYDDEYGWPTNSSANRGHAVELSDPFSDNNDFGNWTSSDAEGTYMYSEDGVSGLDFGTPGESNSNYTSPIYGCTNSEACNYNPSATIDDGTCTFINYSAGECDCEGNSVDCAGVCGGDSFIDDCGNCVVAGTNTDDCLDADNGLPTEFSLSQNFPNPFNPTTNISFDVADGGKIKIIIYDILGNYVNTIVSSYFSQGSYSVNWNGTDEIGNYVSSGIYIYQLIHNDGIINKKMILLR